jgi:RecA-family ATPase
MANALGKEHLGVVPRLGKALFMDAEEDTDEIHHRLHEICRLFDNADYRALIDAGELNICSLVELGAVMAAPTRSGMIEPTALYRRFIEMCGDIKPVLTVVANSANVFAGNENDRGQVQQFVDMLRKGAIDSGGAVILVSHPSLTGIATKSGLSGSTQWHNAVRSRMVLSGVEKDDYDGNEPMNDMRVMKFHKNNYGPLSDQIVLRWQNGLFIPVVNTTADQAERHARAEEVYLTVLHVLIGQGHDLSANKKSGTAFAATMIAVHSLAKDFLPKEMEAAQQRLLDANKIHIATEGPPSKPRKRIMPGPGPKPEEEPM